ncbi:hypothetical protein [Mycolicibacterium thermoresistibile]
MNTNHTDTRGSRRHGTVFVATVLALGVGALIQPATSQAEAVWDIGAYDKCIKAANNTYGQTADDRRLIDEYKFCCHTTGGQWHPLQGCTAPPVTAPPPQSPGEVVQAPGTGTAAEDSPVRDSETPAPAPAPPTPTTVRYSPGWGI